MSTFRSPWDFSVGGCIVQDSSQLSLLRESYASEARTQAMGREVLQRSQEAARAAEEEREAAAARAVQKALRKQQKLQEHKQAIAQRHAARTAALHIAIPLPNLLPFSSHSQRMPPPLLSARRAGTSRSSRTATRVGGSLTARPRVAEQIAPGASLNMRTQEQAQQLFRYCQQQQQGDRGEYRPEHVAPQLPLPQPPRQSYQPLQHWDQRGGAPLGSQTARQAHQQPFAPSSPPWALAPAVAASGSLTARHHAAPSSPQPLAVGQRRSNGHSLTDANSSSDSAPAARSASHFPLAPHPFYTHSTRVLTETDQAFRAQLDARYPRGHIPPAPLDVAQQARLEAFAAEKQLQQQQPSGSNSAASGVPAPAPAPAPYRLNEWSIEWNAHKKKCRETRLQEYLIAKRYI